MARKPTGRPTGRPEKVIDWKVFESLCKIQCTQSETASVLDVHHQTLINRVESQYGEEYASVYKKFAQNGKASLRRTQFDLARKNAAMAIWLGKQYLDQKDTNLKDIRDASRDGVIEAVREIERLNSGDSQTGRSFVEAQQPILDKEPPRQAHTISNELGPEGII